MEDIKEVVEQIKVLSQIIKNSDLTGNQLVVERINSKIRELKTDFNTFIVGHDLFNLYNVDVMNYDDFANLVYEVDAQLYKYAFDAATEYKSYSIMGDVLASIKEITREFYATRRDITLLEGLLD